MSTKNTFYKTEQVKCKKDSCGKPFEVVISSLKAHVVLPVTAFKIKGILDDNQRTVSKTIQDYIVEKCPDEHWQRIYLF